MDDQWVRIAEEVAGDDEPEIMEIQCEPDGTLLLDSVIAQFPGVTGLRFKNPSTGGYRGVRITDKVLHPPSAAKGWGEETTYFCVRPGGAPPKPKAAPAAAASSNNSGDVSMATETSDDGETGDLIVLGLPYKTSEETCRKYFSKYGELTLCEVKKDRFGASKGFAFIRFKEMEAQNKVCLTKHEIEGRWCDVNRPKNKGVGQNEAMQKCYVSGIPDSLTEDAIRSHFVKFGTLKDLYYPSPRRGFCFVTFNDPKVAVSLVGKTHTIEGNTVNIGAAMPRDRDRRGGGRDDYGGDRRGGGGGRRDGGYGGGGHRDRSPFRPSGGGRSGAGGWGRSGGGDMGGDMMSPWGNIGGYGDGGYGGGMSGYGGGSYRGGSGYM